MSLFSTTNWQMTSFTHAHTLLTFVYAAHRPCDTVNENLLLTFEIHVRLYITIPHQKFMCTNHSNRMVVVVDFHLLYSDFKWIAMLFSSFIIRCDVFRTNWQLIRISCKCEWEKKSTQKKYWSLFYLCLQFILIFSAWFLNILHFGMSNSLSEKSTNIYRNNYLPRLNIWALLL